MSNFRTKLLGLAAVATAFAGMSYAQTITCTAGAGTPGAATNPSLRQEGQTELVADLNSTCTVVGVIPAGGDVSTLSITPGLTITSKAVTPVAPATGNSEAAATFTFTPGGAVVTVQGTASGTQASFQITIPAATTSFTVLVQNIRVNASTSATPQVSESGVLSYPTGAATSNAGIAALGVGYILQTLGPATIAGASITSQTACAGNPGTTFPPAPAATSFTVAFKELIGGAFKTNLAAPGGEGGTYTPGVLGIGTATSATQITLTLANIPSLATVYLPASLVPVSGGAGALTLASGGIASGPYAGDVAFTPTSNTVTATYSVTTAIAAGPQNFSVPVIVQYAPNTVAAQTTQMTALVSYAPTAAVLTGVASAIPTFVATTATAANGSVVTLCQTTLMFPFVTNQQGFDTGIVFANTSTDNLGSTKVPSLATAQSGLCTMSFYGTGLPTVSTGVADPLGSLPTAMTHAFLLSQVAPAFQGYLIATCPFQYAHGFAFIEDNLLQPNGVVEGYLAEVLTRAGGADAVTF